VNSKRKNKRVNLQLVFIDAWSCLKIAFLIALALAAVTVVVTFAGWNLFVRTGLLDNLSNLLIDIAGAHGSSLVSGMTLQTVMAFTGVVALLELIVVTTLGAVFAALFNLAVRVTGGAKVAFDND
jgi:hypothetical protein